MVELRHKNSSLVGKSFLLLPLFFLIYIYKKFKAVMHWLRLLNMH